MMDPLTKGTLHGRTNGAVIQIDVRVHKRTLTMTIDGASPKVCQIKLPVYPVGTVQPWARLPHKVDKVTIQHAELMVKGNIYGDLRDY